MDQFKRARFGIRADRRGRPIEPPAGVRSAVPIKPLDIRGLVQTRASRPQHRIVDVEGDRRVAVPRDGERFRDEPAYLIIGLVKGERPDREAELVAIAAGAADRTDYVVDRALDVGGRWEGALTVAAIGEDLEHEISRRGCALLSGVRARGDAQTDHDCEADRGGLAFG